MFTANERTKKKEKKKRKETKLEEKLQKKKKRKKNGFYGNWWIHIEKIGRKRSNGHANDGISKGILKIRFFRAFDWSIGRSIDAQLGWASRLCQSPEAEPRRWARHLCSTKTWYFRDWFPWAAGIRDCTLCTPIYSLSSLRVLHGPEQKNETL